MRKYLKDSLGVCPECGAIVKGGRAACQQLFEEILAKQFGDFNYAKEHRLTVDTYALQHPDTYMKSAKSFAAHLTGLCVAIDAEDKQLINHKVQKWLSTTREISRPDPPEPRQRGKLTVQYVHESRNAEEHITRVRNWAGSAWEAWRDHEALAKKWIKEATT